ncbi:MAG: tRNA (guanosine(37)-N1)-methyltransferase TrmD [Actinobacteria bacterium]|jgi:tRNA (guanine37-N1)-methyltransferase|nr:tRNA (guanosine(37)-N1)-methyltransferase TrmD [Actinomycetota bacterium]MCO5300279.1 tRNA (guanosine(37)-N1)-methyltransferase TrmD [Candidatus Nanopelagicales bacterium]MCB9428200.1 tRNA (guanosine(37)-N1)-methyltransferase TrmD [Actinomycetota bacterium]HPE10921.1 tRNA (guanosine(37)-N1)-methyltransferase TrmD [Actinomycetota bacterium]HPJ19086.1 tRNA (guanosine(37)-N1)-methyltransferase TrmD [Actinomycetota bacterium]
MRIDIVSIFPEYLQPLKLSLIGKAVERGQVVLSMHDLRDFTHDRHRTVDDAPYGGGPGMVMSPQPWGEALDTVLTDESTLIVPTPSGQTFTQSQAEELAQRAHLVFACGRYEGIDARVVEYFRSRVEVREISIGDYVLAGGEAATLVMCEAIGRLLPGVLGNPLSAVDDSFSRPDDLLEGPVYTRPPQWRGLPVPPVLLSGDHERIRQWREERARERTEERAR